MPPKKLSAARHPAPPSSVQVVKRARTSAPPTSATTTMRQIIEEEQEEEDGYDPVPAHVAGPAKRTRKRVEIQVEAEGDQSMEVGQVSLIEDEEDKLEGGEMVEVEAGGEGEGDEKEEEELEEQYEGSQSFGTENDAIVSELAAQIDSSRRKRAAKRASSLSASTRLNKLEKMFLEVDAEMEEFDNAEETSLEMRREKLFDLFDQIAHDLRENRENKGRYAKLVAAKTAPYEELYNVFKAVMDGPMFVDIDLSESAQGKADARSTQNRMLLAKRVKGKKRWVEEVGGKLKDELDMTIVIKNLRKTLYASLPSA